MTFPATPRPMLFELQASALDWTNVTDDVFSLKAPTTFTDGVPNEYGLSQPSTCNFWLNNKLGRYAPRNPLSPLYKQIGRNTPVRVSIGEGAYGMVTSGVADSAGRAQAADSAATSITGDLDIRVDMELLQDPLSGLNSSWVSSNFDIASKFDDADTARSWTLILIGGKLRLSWFSAGTVASAKSATSSVAVGVISSGRKILRVTLDVDNGAGGNTVSFYTGTDINSNSGWTLLGTAVTQAGTTSVFDGTAPTRIGGNPTASIYTYTEPGSATYYSAQVRNGIGGTVVAYPIFSAQPLDPAPFSSSTFSDAQGNSWSFLGTADAARIWYGNVDVRFCGECSSFPNKWDTSEADKWVPIEAAGLLRRLGSGTDPAPSGVRDWVLSQPHLPTSYFPLSGGEGTTYSVNLGRVGTNSLRFYGISAPAFTYGKDMGAPWIGSGMEYTLAGNGLMQADVAAGDDNFALDFVFQSPHLGRLEFWIYDYAGNAWQVYLNHDSDDKLINAFMFDKFGGVTGGFPIIPAVPEFSDTAVHTCRIQVISGVSDQTLSVYIDGTLRYSGTTGAGGTFGPGPSGYQMILGRTGAQEPVNLAHLTLWSFPSFLDIPAVTAFDFAARGFAGEDAVTRMQRVATTGGIPFTYAGNSGDSMPMGPLYSEGKLTQMRDAEAADMGILGEQRAALGLHYRTRLSMVDQNPALTLDYSLGQIVPPFEPVDDDLLTKNDITVTRRDGGSVRQQITTGRLSVSEPPAGVGRYHDQLELNVLNDALLPDIAAWLLNLGTVDQPRYPTVTVDLGLLAAAGLDLAARKVKFGDLLVIKNMNRVGVYGDVRLLVLGRANETISDGAFKHTITWNCAPYQGYEGFTWANAALPDATGPDARWDTPGSTLVSGISSSATSFSVASTATPWTTDPTAFPFDVVMEGERITISNITGTTSAQTFTASARSVNGVVKAQVAGADIRLADPSYWSLGGS